MVIVNIFCFIVGLVKWDLVDFVFFRVVIVDWSGYLYVGVVRNCDFRDYGRYLVIGRLEVSRRVGVFGMGGMFIIDLESC